MAERPTGTVTFLFTDIESSSGLWESEPVAMSEALAAHDQILDSVIAAEGGLVFKHLGDGMCAAFSSAPAALVASVRAQRELAAEGWNLVGPLMVRMGLHTGSVVPTEGDYFGPVVNRAARVMGTANGGQIVCSAATKALCPDSEWFDHGVHVLRGVGEEHLFALAAEDLAAERGLRVSDDMGSRLPVDPTSFVGRDRDVLDLVAALGTERLVTLVGVGGVGKTRLAVETAGIAADRFAGGVWWCDLAPALDGDAMAATVIDVLGARPQLGMDAAASIVNHLEGREMLLVLDNCEHLVSDVGRLVDAVLALTGVVVLATSREPLGLRAEQVWAVGSLEAATAGSQLFLDRARQRDRRFELSGDQVEIVRGICERLDGIPLAIELAAARTRSMSVNSIAERLDDRFRLLRGGRKGERHQTLRDTVGWSYDLLDPAEAGLFDRLSVFSGGLTLSAAESVCADGAVVDELDVVDLLETLVDKSMLVADTSNHEVRYQLLETLRQFAEEQLHNCGDSRRFRDLHAQFYRGLAVGLEAQQWTDREPEIWVEWNVEWDNMRSAQSHARSIHDNDTAADIIAATSFYSMSSMRVESSEWGAALLDVEGIEAQDRYADLCGCVAVGAQIRADQVRALERAATGVGVDPANWACTMARVLVALFDGNRDLTAEAVDTYRTALGDSATGIDRVLLETFTAWTDHTDASLPAADTALGAALDTGCPSLIALGHQARYFALKDSQPGQALHALEAMVETVSPLSSRHILALNARMYLADHTATHLPPPEALAYCRDALQATIDGQHLSGVYMTLETIALALARHEEHAIAAQIFGHVETSGHTTNRMARRIEPLIASEEDYARGTELTRRQACDIAFEAIDAHLKPVEIR